MPGRGRIDGDGMARCGGPRGHCEFILAVGLVQYGGEHGDGSWAPAGSRCRPLRKKSEEEGRATAWGHPIGGRGEGKVGRGVGFSPWAEEKGRGGEVEVWVP